MAREVRASFDSTTEFRLLTNSRIFPENLFPVLCSSVLCDDPNCLAVLEPRGVVKCTTPKTGRSPTTGQSGGGCDRGRRSGHAKAA